MKTFRTHKFARVRADSAVRVLWSCMQCRVLKIYNRDTVMQAHSWISHSPQTQCTRRERLTAKNGFSPDLATSASGKASGAHQQQHTLTVHAETGKTPGKFCTRKKTHLRLALPARRRFCRCLLMPVNGSDASDEHVHLCTCHCTGTVYPFPIVAIACPKLLLRCGSKANFSCTGFMSAISCSCSPSS